MDAAPAPAAAPAVRRARAVPAPRAAAPPWTAYHVALAAMLLTYVWRVQDLFPLLGRARPAVLASLAGMWLLFMGPLPSLGLRLRHPVVRAALFLAVVAVLSVPGSVWPGYSFRFLIDDHFKTLLLMLLMVAAIRTLHDVERMMAVHVAGGALYCAVILSRYQVGADGRLNNLVYYDSNDLAMLAVCTFPMVVYQMRPGVPPPRRLMSALVLLLLCVTVVQTGSRGGFLGLVAVFAVMLATFGAVPRAQRIGSVAVVALMLAIVGGDAFWDKMGTLLRPSEDYNWAGNSEGGRIDVWKRGMGYMVERPLLGVGVNAYPIAEGTISPLAGRQELGEGLKWSAAHNSFVQIAAELGVPGFAGFLLMLWGAFRVTGGLARGGTERGRAPPGGAAAGQALTATLVGYCVSGFFLSQAYSAYLYSVLGIVAGLAFVAGHAAEPAPGAAAAPVRRPAGRGGLVVAPRAQA